MVIGLAVTACFEYETEVCFWLIESRTISLCHRSIHVHDVLVSMQRRGAPDNEGSGHL